MARASRNLADEIYTARRTVSALARSRQVSRSYVSEDGSSPLEVVDGLHAATTALRQAEAASVGDRANLVSDPDRELPWGESWEYLRDAAGADLVFEPQTFDSAGPWKVVPYTSLEAEANGIHLPSGYLYDFPVSYRPSVSGKNGAAPAGDWYGASMPYLQTTARGLRPGARYRWSAELAVHLRQYDFAFLGVGGITRDLFHEYDESGAVSPRLFGTWFDVVPTRLSIEFVATTASMPLWIGRMYQQAGDDADPDIARAVWFRDTLLDALPTTDPNRGG